MQLESDLRGLTFRQAINKPHLVGMHWCFVLVTMMFVWTLQLDVMLLLLGYWAFDFGIIWFKWHCDNKPRNPNNHLPPFRTVPGPEAKPFQTIR